MISILVGNRYYYSYRSSSRRAHQKLPLIFLLSGTEGSVQLRGGVVPEAGTVEFCIGGVWQAVCDSNWDYKDAFVVCRELQFPATGK